MEKIYFLLTFFFAILIADHQSEATATFEWTLLKFVNPGGKQSNGEKCEWYNECDHKFRFGMDWLTGNNDTQDTPILTKQTGVFDNQNTNIFSSGTDNKGVYNPIKQKFNTWQGGVLLKVYIEDSDDIYGIEYVDSIMYKLVAKPSWGALVSNPVSTVMSSRTSLYFAYRIYCDENYYGNDCAKYCKDQNDNINGHYSCDVFGNKVCLYGWNNKDNNSMDCQNDLLNVNGVWPCQCKPGVTEVIIIAITLLVACILLRHLFCISLRPKRYKQISTSSEVFSHLCKSAYDPSPIRLTVSLPKDIKTPTVLPRLNLFESDKEQDGFISKIFGDMPNSKIAKNQIGSGKNTKDDADDEIIVI